MQCKKFIVFLILQENYLKHHQKRPLNAVLYNNIYDPYKPYARHALKASDYGKHPLKINT